MKGLSIMVKRILAVILVVICMATVIISCSGDDNKDNPTGTATAGSSDGYPALPDVTYNNANFNILVRSSGLPYFEQETDSESVVSSSVYRRNLAVIEKYQINLTFSHMDGFAAGQTAFKEAIRKSVTTGAQEYDIVAPGYYYGNQMGVEGLFEDINDFDYIALDQTYWWDGYNEPVTINGKTFTICGDYSIESLECMQVVFFNKELYREYFIDAGEDLYTVVNKGEWTIDRMLELAKTASDDVNPSEYGEKDTNVGLTFYVQSARNIPTMCGIKYITSSDKGIELTYYSEKTEALYSKIYEAINKNSGVYFTNYKLASMYDKFTVDGKALFMIHNLEGIEIMRASEVDFGILPCPKYDTEQEDYIAPSVGGTCFAIPVGLDDPERSSVILEMMGRESYKTTTPAFWEITLKSRTARDDESAEMLQLIRDHLYYDFALLYANDIDILIQGFGERLYEQDATLASWWGGISKVYSKVIDSKFS